MNRYKLYLYEYSEDSFTAHKKEIPLDFSIVKDSIVISLIEKGYLDAQDIAFVDVKEVKGDYKIINKNNQIIFSIEKVT